MRTIHLVVTLIAFLLVAACGSSASGCPPAPEASRYLTVPPEALPTATPSQANTPILVPMGNKTIKVDKVVEGPLCHDTWRGTVYVTCNVQVYPWEETPTFLDGCNLVIEPGTVVYVAAHNNTAYYNGCSCHYRQETK